MSGCRGWVVGALMVGAACSGPPTAPPQAAQPSTWTLDREKVIAALDYFRDVAGLTYVLIDRDESPRLLIRPGTDGLAAQGGGRGGVDGTAADNRASSGLVVIEPGGGSYCAFPASQQCRYLYRHEIGHALGFSGHSGLVGLMQSGSDQLHPRELAMVLGLYALPHGAGLSTDGAWRVDATGQHGTIDSSIAADIVNWNMAPASSHRRSDLISRWDLPVRVFLVDEVFRR